MRSCLAITKFQTILYFPAAENVKLVNHFRMNFSIRLNEAVKIKLCERQNQRPNNEKGSYFTMHHSSSFQRVSFQLPYFTKVCAKCSVPLSLEETIACLFQHERESYVIHI